MTHKRISEKIMDKKRNTKFLCNIKNTKFLTSNVILGKTIISLNVFRDRKEIEFFVSFSRIYPTVCRSERKKPS